jgi:hypothetical protein
LLNGLGFAGDFDHIHNIRQAAPKGMENDVSLRMAEPIQDRRCERLTVAAAHEVE